MSQVQLPPSLSQLLEEGGLFEDKYRLIGEVGQGSFASVLHARHETMDRDVALKVLRPDVLKDHPEVGERFLNEGRLASRLTSPHTVMVFDFGETEEGVPYMVLEYVDGRPLDYAIEKYGALGLKRSFRITAQILESLEEAHNHNIIHRDLKPANVMVGEGMKRQKEGVHVKVLDFGVAKRVDEPEGGVDLGADRSGRHSTQFIGTPRYMSPEQILGREVRPASDLYSLGLILFEMCTGTASIPGDNVAKVAQTHLSEKPLELQGLDELPDPVRHIILTATARHPEDRYGSAEEFQAAIDDAVERGRKKSQRARQVAVEEALDNELEESDSSGPRPERNSDVFSGEGYVELPDEDELPDSVSSTGPNPGKRPPSPSSSSSRGPRRPPSPGGSRPGASSKRPGRGGNGAAAGADTDSGQLGLDDSGELELDIEAVSSQRRNRRSKRSSREEFARRAEQSEDRPGLHHWVGSTLVVVVAGYVGFILVGGALGSLDTGTRSVMGLLPVGLALLWAIFSENAYRDVARRILVPWARYAVVTVAVALVVMAVAMPLEASASLRDQALWFLHEQAWLAGPTEAICGFAAWLLELFGALVPWAD